MIRKSGYRFSLGTNAKRLPGDHARTKKLERDDDSKKSHPALGRRRQLADLVDTVWIEGNVILDLRHRIKWGLVSPHRIEPAIPASRNAVVGSVALVGTIRRVFAARESGHIDIPTGYILNGRIRRLAKRQRIARVGNQLSADSDPDARR